MSKLPPGLSSKDFGRQSDSLKLPSESSGCSPAMRMWRCIEIPTPSS